MRALHSGLYDRCGGVGSWGSGAARVRAMVLPVMMDMFEFFDVRGTKVGSSSTGRLKYRPGNMSRSGKPGVNTGKQNSPFAQRGVYRPIASLVMNLV